ncbi:tyrosine-protein phosphatase non-receptor type 2-like isoform X2 [Patiria miniata]|uniref:protein-tyrosine-phosphatase n=1 Tax=Patiria miniata TaxID=46514 RepID=A0A914BRT0_PATMI|nr:tyrosine-protein phosphatase non-receptor type 2-like isoform X2 [Patiria miniata]
MLNIQEEFDECERKGTWRMEFQKINIASHQYDYSTTEAKKEVNKPYNRYRDVSPYNHTRIVLGNGTSDYINASLVTETRANRRYILAQGPLPTTIGHFWQMIWEQKSKAVIMLNNIIEKGTRKCAQYYPVNHSNLQTIQCEQTDLQVSILREDEHSFYTVRTLELKNRKTNESTEVLHLHYTRWPDFGVPKSPEAFLKFLHHVRQTGSLSEDVGPPVIHCSAGIGRSGTFCLVDTCLVLIEKAGHLNGVSVKELLLEMRRCRMGLIQTHDQLRFSYLAILAGARAILDGKGLESLAREDGEEDAPPPLPRKLKRPHSPGEQDSNDTKTARQEDANDVKSQDHDGNPGTSETELRRRRREEKTRAMQDKLGEIRSKQRKSEWWRKHRSLFRYLGVGLGLGLGVCALFLYRWFYGGAVPPLPPIMGDEPPAVYPGD